jgi:hypothetical protein
MADTQTRPLVREGAPYRQDSNFQQNKQISGHKPPQMGLDTKTDRLTDRQSQCDSDSDWLWLWRLTQSLPVATTFTTRQQQTYVSSDRWPASGQITRPECAEPAWALPTGKISEVLHSLLPQCTGNPAQRSSAGYPLAACRIQPAAIRALQYLVALNRPFPGPALPHQLQHSPSASCQPPAYPTSEDSCVVLRGCAPTSH